jgi:hypothetical protein
MVTSGSGKRSAQRRLRLPLFLSMVGLVGAAAFGLPRALARGDHASTASGDAAAATARPTGQPGAAVRWDGGLLEFGTPQQVTLFFIGSARQGTPVGPCFPAYQAAVRPSRTAVKITLYAVQPQAQPRGNNACPRVGYQRSLVVRLPEPLRGRTVIDGATGQRRQLFDARQVLEPTSLPEGYGPAHTAVVDANGHFIRTWARSGRAQVYLEVTLGGVDLAQRPTHNEVVLARPTIRGVAAKVYKSDGFDDSVCVSWAEGALGRRVCTFGDPTGLLPVAELVRFADGLRAVQSRTAP